MDIIKTSVLVPPVVCHHLDPHTGIPFMPHMAAYLAATLRSRGFLPQVLDSFGISCHDVAVVKKEFMLMGLPIEKMVGRLAADCKVCFIYCRTVSELVAVELLMEELKSRRPDVSIVLFENIQAVTSFSIMEVAENLLRQGADAVISGEPEDRAEELVKRLVSGQCLSGIPGVAYLSEGAFHQEMVAALNDKLDELPFPAWDLFDLDGYWKMNFAHAPVRRGERFLPLLTSRGCPFSCNFCIAPAVNHRWRARSAVNVVEEISFLHQTLGVTDFHISDLNPTVSAKRIREMCRLIIDRKLGITWKLAQGTKIETIKDEDTLELMARAGCKFVSFSPETGSPDLLTTMNKPFDHAHGLKMASIMFRLGIRMQAVFLAGVPGETRADQDKSLEYATQLVKAGVDEISVVVYAPLPGTKFSPLVKGFEHYAQCTPSPSWREDYKQLMSYRRRMYLNLFLRKAIYHPLEFMGNFWRLFTLRFETKMEMSLFKQAKLLALRYM